MAKDPQYAVLQNMQPPETVDCFQGRDANIVVLTLGLQKRSARASQPTNSV